MKIKRITNDKNVIFFLNDVENFLNGVVLPNLGIVCPSSLLEQTLTSYSKTEQNYAI